MKTQQDKDLEQLYELSKNQLAELLFLAEELKFLKSIVDEYFALVISGQPANRIHIIGTELSQLELIRSNIIRDILTHQGNLQSKINGVITQSLDILKSDTQKINKEIDDINRCFRNFKKDIYTTFKNRIPLDTAAKNNFITIAQ